MEFKDKNTDELLKELKSQKEELRTLRFSVAGSKNRNVKRAKGLRKDIARILTELSERRLAPSMTSRKK